MRRNQLPERMGLLPYFIPPHRFMSKEWFAVDAGRLHWFYHRPRTTPSPYHHPRSLDNTVDVGLAPMVAAVRALGLTTGPSCEGHATNRHPIRMIPGLASHARMVRGPGIVVTNVETGQKHLWRDPTYKFSAPLMRQTMRNQDVFKLVGLLPMRGSEDAILRVAQAVHHTPGAWIERCGAWHCVWVATRSAAQQRATWRALAGRVHHA